MKADVISLTTRRWTLLGDSPIVGALLQRIRLRMTCSSKRPGHRRIAPSILLRRAPLDVTSLAHSIATFCMQR